MNKLLITIQHCRDYKQISNSVKQELFNQYILDAQIQDLAPLLGEGLFNDLIFNFDNHTELMNGGTYEHNGITYVNVGLNCVLAHYAYARYTLFGSMVDTPFSQVEKLNNGYSQPVSLSVKKDLYKMNQDTAFTYFGSVKSYLERTEYPMYRRINHCHPVKKGGFRISKI